MRFVFDNRELAPGEIAVGDACGDEAARRGVPLQWSRDGYDVGTGAAGFASVVSVSDGLSVCISEFRVRTPMVEREVRPDADLYQFGCCLEGMMAWRSGDGAEHMIKAANVGILHIDGREYTSTLPSGQLCRFASVIADGAWLRAAVAPDVLGRLDAGPILVPLSAEVDAVARALRAHLGQSWADRLMLEAKARELVARSLMELASMQEPARPVDVPADDFAALLEARAYIDAHFGEAITIASLSREVALNEFKLKRGFKRCFDTTIRAYQRKCRVHAARDLMAGGAASVNEAARAVGYSSVSHFIEAYRAEFGSTPTGRP